jgi:hypothetical protein
MAGYATYEFYLTQYLGTAIAQADFERLSQKASAFIDQVTFGRAATETDTAVLEKMSHATCAVAEEVQKIEKSGGSISSERVGNVSVTYAQALSPTKTMENAAKTYLWDTDLMYRGLNEDER